MSKPEPTPTGTDAVSYLRVSSEGQVNTDFNPEGISLPAQRVAVRERARELAAPIVQEFIDPGKTAKTIEHRDAFRDMIAYLKANPTVRYVIVYALSRFARNRYDDAVMMMTLEKLGVTLISTTERNLDATPAGRAMHGMIAVFNEYQVLVSGEDIKYKMGQKVKNGGSVGKAKLGYQNVRLNFEGREVRTVTIDAERAPLVKLAFELYATGNYGYYDLRDALTDAGLRTKANRRYGPRPVSIHTIGTMLRDRYYLGYVTHDGIEYQGRHEPIIDLDLFEKVQKVLYGERGAGTRTRVHNHYLKGTLWCARCQRRLMLRPSTSKTGEKYFYYICRGLQDHTCDLPSLPVLKVEDAVLEHYTQVTIPARHRTTLETLALSATEGAAEAATILRAGLRKEIAELDRKEDRFLDLIGDPEWPQDKLKARLRDVRETKQRAVRQLENTTNDLEPGRAVLNFTLELLSHPRDLYAAANDKARKLLNKAIFTKIYLDSDEDRQPTITSDDLAEPAAGLVYAVRVTDGHRDQGTMPQNHSGGLLALCLEGQSASKATMVEVAGIEPASADVEPGLLRAQPAAAFLSPGAPTGRAPSRAQSRLVSPQAP